VRAVQEWVGGCVGQLHGPGSCRAARGRAHTQRNRAHARRVEGGLGAGVVGGGNLPQTGSTLGRGRGQPPVLHGPPAHVLQARTGSRGLPRGWSVCGAPGLGVGGLGHVAGRPVGG
jgi:hypothetical protein